MQDLLINRIVALYRKHPRPSLFLFLFNAFSGLRLWALMWFNGTIDISLSRKPNLNLLHLRCFLATLVTFRPMRFLLFIVRKKKVALSLQDNASSEEHVVYVWDHFVSKAEAKNVFVMAHSYGGLSFVELVSSFCFFFISSLITFHSRPAGPHGASPMTFKSENSFTKQNVVC